MALFVIVQFTYLTYSDFQLELLKICTRNNSGDKDYIALKALLSVYSPLFLKSEKRYGTPYLSARAEPIELRASAFFIGLIESVVVK